MWILRICRVYWSHPSEDFSNRREMAELCPNQITKLITFCCTPANVLAYFFTQVLILYCTRGRCLPSLPCQQPFTSKKISCRLSLQSANICPINYHQTLSLLASHTLDYSSSTFVVHLQKLSDLPPLLGIPFTGQPITHEDSPFQSFVARLQYRHFSDLPFCLLPPANHMTRSSFKVSLHIYEIDT